MSKLDAVSPAVHAGYGSMYLYSQYQEGRGERILVLAGRPVSKGASNSVRESALKIKMESN